MSWIWRKYVSVALCLAILVRAAIPAGWMPVADAEHGGIALKLCPGHVVAAPSEPPGRHLHDPGMHEMGDSASHGMDPSNRAVVQDDAENTQDTHKRRPYRDYDGITCPFALTAIFDLPRDEALLQLAFFGPPLLGDAPVIAVPETRPARPPLPPRGPPVRA